ncbi:MAG: DUF2339 domain-containing protein [Pseudomonadota bacterium]|nr:DUF2339 domain-containing protein [Pseudomonadota bacterium]
MTFLAIIALFFCVFLLWTRLAKAEARLEELIDLTGNRLSALERRFLDNAPSPPESEDLAEVAEREPEAEPVEDPEPASIQAARPLPRTIADPVEYDATEQVGAGSETEVEAEEPVAERTGFTFDFEDIFGRRLPIWAGGIALAIAGIFLVRYAIEAGVFTPTFRVISSFTFGLGLIGGAEIAYRNEARIADERVRQALAGAGIATLFGAFYLAGTAYGLIGPTIAFIGLAAVTAAAISLSFRFGLPCAVLGLVGGYAAPLMVQSESANVPLLSLYLALVAGGLTWTGIKQGHRWMGYAALGVGLGWGLFLQILGLDSSADLVSVGVYLVVLGTVLPAFLYSPKGPGVLQLVAAGLATLQMALLVSEAGFALLTWGLYLLIAAALAALGWRYTGLRAASAIAAAVALWLGLAWPDPALFDLIVVVAAMAAIFMGVPLLHQWHDEHGSYDIPQLTIAALGLGAVLGYQTAFWPSSRLMSDTALAASLFAAALFPIASFALMWRKGETLEMRQTLLTTGAAHILAIAALWLITPTWAAPLAAGGLALALALLNARRDVRPLRIAAWAAIAVTLFSLIFERSFLVETGLMGGIGAGETPFTSLLRWLAALPALLILANLRAKTASRMVAEGLCALIAYAALSQVIPGDALAWMAALGAVAIFVWQPERFMGWGALILVAMIWAIEPVATWFFAGLQAMAAMPFMLDGAVALLDIALRLAPTTAACFVIAWRHTDLSQQYRQGFLVPPSVLCLIAAHSLFKQVFGISSLFQFEQFGMAERTIWQALLVLCGYGVLRLEREFSRRAGSALITVGLAHFVYFTLMLHNPLLFAQNVGPTPVANWLLLSSGTAIAAIVLLRPLGTAVWQRAYIVTDTAIMSLIALLAVSLLRQAFSGSILTASYIGSTESLLLSLLGIALALAYLWYGSFTQQRSWRIGSLVLILIAVLKVFLFDAAGLEGLLRIASFMALGFSLIGIGWVYSRQLKRTPAEPNPAAT